MKQWLMKKTKLNWSRLFLKNAFLLLILGLCLFATQIITAQQVDDVNHSAHVTANIPDLEPPSVPILIAPEDEANLATAYPVFQWYGSTDNMGLSHYRFWLDNATWFDYLPLDDYADADYSLDYDPINNIYTFVSSHPLDHGPHRWQITAVDYADNSASSDIWDFNIFIDSPEFNLTQVGDLHTHILATDPSTVPDDPLDLFVDDPDANEPWLIALADANLAVNLVVTIPDDPVQNFNQSSDELGNWSLQLGILPRDTVIRLDFTISDVVGNQSIIENLYIRLYQHYWPPTATPTPTPTSTPTPTLSLSPTPTLTPSLSFIPSLTLSPSGQASPSVSLSPTLSPTPSPSVSIAQPGIRVPIIPPKEIVHELVQETTERLPQPIAVFISRLLRSDWWSWLQNFISLLLVIFLPLTSYLLLNLKFIKDWSVAHLKQTALALWPWSKRGNLVFEYRSATAAPLVKVELLNADNGQVLDWQITNYLGQFAHFSYPNQGNLQLRVKDQNFFFPVGEDRSPALIWQSFYQQQLFNRQIANLNRAWAIPTLLASGRYSLPIMERLRTLLAYLLTYPWWFWSVSFMIELLFTLRYPTIYNWLGILLALTIALLKVLNRQRGQHYQLDLSLLTGQKVKGNMIVIENDLLTGQSQAQVVNFDMGLSDPLQFKQSTTLLSIFAYHTSWWEQNQAISEVYLDLQDGLVITAKMRRLAEAEQTSNFLRAVCRLLPPPPHDHS